MSSDNLKPCPFCGGESEYANNFGRTSVQCVDCHIGYRPYSVGEDERIAESSKAWNTRHQSEETSPMADMIKSIAIGNYENLQEQNKALLLTLDKARNVINALIDMCVALDIDRGCQGQPEDADVIYGRETLTEIEKHMPAIKAAKGE